MDLTTQLSNFGSDNESTPPDTTLGTGNGFVVEPLNDSLSIYNSGGTLLRTVDLYSFYASVLPSGQSLSDPQAVYDSVTPGHRFYMTDLAYNPTTFDRELLVAVSQPNDPTRTWSLYDLANMSGVLQDQPLLGLANDKLTISVNDFNLSQAFLGSTTYVLNKSDVDAGTSPHMQSFGPEAFWRPSPARSTSSTTTQYVVSIDNASPTLDVMAITGVPSSTTSASRTVTSLSINPTATPPNASQPGQPTSITTNDVRALEAVWQDNALWVGSNDGCTPTGDSTQHSCLRLIQVAAPVSGTPAVLQDFDLGTVGADLYFPGLSLDQKQNLYVGYTVSDASTTNPSADVAAFLGGQATVATVTRLQTGTTYSGFDSAPFRWGDYSGAAIDPTNPDDVWVATEFGGGDSSLGTGTNWATQLSQVTLAPIATSTSLSASANPASTNEPVVYTASVSPTPDGGTVAFSDNGTTLPGCGAQPISTTTGEATCTTTYPATGSHAISATYSGSTSFGPSTSALLNETIMVPPQGYWLVASDGGLFASGEAGFFGSTGAMTLNRPVVGMAATPDGQGYWLVASDGGLFAFGDAGFFGSTGSIILNRPIVAMSATQNGAGYRLIASDGGVFSFGNAVFAGSMGGTVLNRPVVGAASSG